MVPLMAWRAMLVPPPPHSSPQLWSTFCIPALMLGTCDSAFHFYSPNNPARILPSSRRKKQWLRQVECPMPSYQWLPGGAKTQSQLHHVRHFASSLTGEETGAGSWGLTFSGSHPRKYRHGDLKPHGF